MQIDKFEGVRQGRENNQCCLNFETKYCEIKIKKIAKLLVSHFNLTKNENNDGCVNHSGRKGAIYPLR